MFYPTILVEADVMETRFRVIGARKTAGLQLLEKVGKVRVVRNASQVTMTVALSACSKNPSQKILDWMTMEVLVS
jgi:hypothetical protein